VDAALSRAHEGQGQLVVVEATHGMGRSVLAAAAAQRASDRGLQPLLARGSGPERGFSHGVALQLLEPVLEDTPPEDRDRLFTGAGTWARAVLDPSDRVGHAADDAFRVAHGLTWVVERLAAVRPVAIVVDDLHLVDEASLLFLAHLANRLDRLPCSMLLTATSLDGDRPLVHELRCHPHAVVLELGPLPPEALAEHLRAEHLPGATPALCRMVADLSGGNPLLATELAAAVDLDGSRSDGATVARLRHLVTRSIRNAIETQINELDDPSRHLAMAAALMEGDAPLDAAAYVAGLDRGLAEKAARLLVDAGIVRAGDPLDLATPVIGSALRTLIPADELPRLCRRAADALTWHGRTHLDVAGHLLRAAPAGDDSVVARLWSAALQAIAGGDPTAAVAYLRRAVAEPAPIDVRPDLLMDLGRAAALLDDGAALKDLEEAAALHRDRDRRAAALLIAGRLRADIGHTSDAAATLERALDLNPRDPSLRCAIRAQHLAVTQLDLRRRRAHRTGGVDLGVAPSIETPEQRSLLASATLEKVVRGVDMEPAARWASVLATRLAAGGARDEPDAVAATAGALVWLGWPARAGALLDASLAAACDSGDLATAATLSTRRAMVRAMCGDLPAAASDARWALSAAGARWSRFRPAAQAVLASSLIAVGDLDAARSTLAASDAVDAWQQSPLGVLLLVTLGDLDLADGDPAAALARYAHLAEVARDMGIGNPIAVPHRLRRAAAHLQLGERDAGRALADEALAEARALGLELAEARSLRIAALTCVRTEAASLLRRAVAAFDAADARLDLAGAHLDLGTVLVASDRRRDGIDHLRRAEELATACGAAPLAERARAQLRRAGSRARRPGSGIDALTPGERRAAELARSGLTNREIAEQLFVSVKAVEWHLGNVYRKLGVRGRRDLARVETFEPSSGATRR
jgi:DNA-binding CsgD family transcriptional regulator